jgi:outer membrane cobalamin receptor
VQGYGGVWQPVNLAAERATGHEDHVRVSAFDKLFTLSYQNTVTDSKSRVPGHTTYGKALPFVPAFVQQLSARVEHRYGYAVVTSRHVGKRWATQANTRFYDSFRVTDLALGAHMRPSHWLMCTLEYKAANMGNEDYVLTSHYPMPGREWTVGLTLSIELEDNDE